MTPEQEAKLIALNQKATEVPIEVTQTASETPEVPSEAVPQVESTEQLEEVAPVTAETPAETPQEPEAMTLTWDDEPTTTEKPAIDFNRIGSAIGSEVKSEEDVVKYIEQLKSSKKAEEEIPEDFREVIKVAKVGDWREYVAADLTDWSKESPLTLYEDWFFHEAAKLPQFRNPDGSLNEQAVYDAVDATPEVNRMIEGNRIKGSMIAQQNARKQEIVRKAEAKYELAEKSLTEATKSLDKLIPSEKYGIKIEAKDQAAFYQNIKNSKLTKQYLGVSFDDLVKSGADMTAVVKTIATSKFAEQSLEVKSKSAKATAAKEILSTLQNAQIQSPVRAVDPTPETPIKTTVDLMRDYVSSSKKGL